MDLALIKTFLAVSSTGSFVSAAGQLFVTQSAVSLRVQRLEDLLGHPLFLRSKSGAELTPQGREFESYAQSLMRTWEQARQQVAIPEGFEQSLTIGAEGSLWPRLGFRMLDGLRAAMPKLGLRAETGSPAELTQAMTEGTMQIALTYEPTLRPGLSVERLIEDELVLVTPWANPKVEDLPGRYAFIDWGTDFLNFHNANLPDLSNPGLTLALGATAGGFIVRRDRAAFLPARYVKRYLDGGKLHLVPDVPSHGYIAWSVWRDDLEDQLADVARATLLSVAEGADEATSEVIDQI